MSSKLEVINKKFEQNFPIIFQKPEKIQMFLKDRSKEFDQLIVNKFLNLKLDGNFALIALGGYGRNELFPSSDIDLSIIQFTNKPTNIEELKEFIAWLWNLKVKVGHSVRTIKDIEIVTKNDLKEFTSYLSYRILYCQKTQLSPLKKNLKKILKGWTKSKFFKAKKLEQISRFESFDSTEFNLEPDLKESPGCLRDYQTALWILEHCFEIKDLTRSMKLKLFSKKQILKINASYAHIKTLRFMLNLCTNSNRISFENQLLLAKKSKLKSTKNSSDVEKFMRMFFLHASKLSDFNEMIFQAYEDQLSLLKRPYKKNYYIFKDRLGIHDHINISKKPEFILETFLQIGRLKKINGLDFKSMQKIQNAIPLIEKSFFTSKIAGKQFIQILRSQFSLSTILKKLKQLGILRLLIPEFGEIEGQMQFDMFHIYTVDEHTFKVVRNMRQMQIGKIDESLQIEHELINKLPKIELLYLAGIFHDLGKGKGGNHSDIGKKIVTKFSKRLGFSIHDTELLAWLVKYHLIMSSTSQRSDVHDRETIINFTKTVDSIEILNYIYMLTVNDIRGTNPNLWNSWKHDLLKRLFFSSRKKLNLEEPEISNLIIKERKKKSLEIFNKNKIKTIKTFWDQLPESYFAKYQLKQLQNQALVISNSDLKTSVKVMKRKNLMEIFIFTPNQSGLFFKTVTIFEKLSLETIDANIQTTNDGNFALNTFICRHKILGNNLTQRDKYGIEEKIIMQLSSSVIPKASKNKLNNKKVFSHLTKVEIGHLKNQDGHLVTLETLDQPSLLSKIAKIFLKNEVSIFSARITTLGEKVEDNFVIMNEKSGTKINQNKQKKIINELKKL